MQNPCEQAKLQRNRKAGEWVSWRLLEAAAVRRILGGPAVVWFFKRERGPFVSRSPQTLSSNMNPQIIEDARQYIVPLFTMKAD